MSFEVGPITQIIITTYKKVLTTTAVILDEINPCILGPTDFQYKTEN